MFNGGALKRLFRIQQSKDFKLRVKDMKQNKTLSETTSSVKVQPTLSVERKIDSDTKKDIFWSVGAYLVPLILSFFVSGDIFPIVCGVGMFFTGLVVYYWCFDKPAKSNIHWLSKAGLMVVFLPALAFLELPYLFLLGWI